MILYLTLALVAAIASYSITHDWLTSIVLAFAIITGAYQHLYRGVVPAMPEGKH